MSSKMKETRASAWQETRGPDHPKTESNSLIGMGPLSKEDEMGDNVQNILNSKWVLQWHPSARGTKVRTQSPHVVDLWIERGYRRNRTEIVEPKLMWRDLHQPDLYNKRKLGGSTLRPYRLSLFAIRRVTQVKNEDGWDKLNMSLPHPLTDLNRLLVVRSSLGDDFVFEASCAAECASIVHALKMVTARLVSHAVVGTSTLIADPNLCCLIDSEKDMAS